MEQHRAPKISYRVRNIHLEDGIWKATLTTWEGCCSNIHVKEVSIYKDKRPTSKDFIKNVI